MRGVLIALDLPARSTAPFCDLSLPLLPMVGRPLLQHAVDRMVGEGVRDLHVIAGGRSRSIEAFLGDGARWGCSFRVHLVRDPRHPYRALRRILEPGDDGPVLLGHSNRLPLTALPAPASAGKAPIYVLPGGRWGTTRWTGWAWLVADDLAEDRVHTDSDGLESHFERATARHVVLTRFTDTRTPSGLIVAHERVLTSPDCAIVHGGREVEPGVWRSSGVRIHPSVELVPPVFLGTDAAIDAGVRLGPNATVGAGCVIDRDVVVRDSVLFEGSYVGPGLTLDGVLLRGAELHDSRLAVTVALADQGVLGDIRRNARSAVPGPSSPERLAAAGLLAASLPLLAATGACLKRSRRGPLLHHRQVATPRAAGGPARSPTFVQISLAPFDEPLDGPRHLLLRVLPGLVHVARGSMSLVGVEPRTPEELAMLPLHATELIGTAKLGLINQSDADGMRTAPDLDRQIADLYYTARRSGRHDRDVVVRYLRRLYLALGRRRRTAGEAGPPLRGEHREEVA